MRGATNNGGIPVVMIMISTHTPHAGRDCASRYKVKPQAHFNSHAPCGARLPRLLMAEKLKNFNSHAPCGARPSPLNHAVFYFPDFNSHAPCGARRAVIALNLSENDFNSHAPCGARRGGKSIITADIAISTHTPHAGRDPAIGSTDMLPCISTHTPHAGRDLFGKVR